MIYNETFEYFYILNVPKYRSRNVFKIGKTTQEPQKRFKAYDSDTKVELVISVKNCTDFERKIISLFKKEFKLVDGREYFEGDLNKMIDFAISMKKEESNLEWFVSEEDLEELFGEIEENLLKEVLNNTFRKK